MLGKHPSGCSFGLLWLRKMARELEKDFKKGIIGIYFMKIKENKRKGRLNITNYM